MPAVPGLPGVWTRREWLAAVAAAAGTPLLPHLATSAHAQARTADLLLVNGRFVDHRGAVASALALDNGRISWVGQAGESTDADRVVDLGGRTVIPGLFDGHVHFTRAGVNPGYEARRVERAFSIAALQQVLAARASSVPPGAFITCIGGWNHTQFAERRPPTPAELDDAAPDHAVYLSGTGGGTGALTNGRGRTFLTARGVEVDEAGRVGNANAAVAALRAAQTPEDRLRGTAELNTHANALGLTAVINPGIDDQDLPLRLWREGRLTIRMRPTFPANSPEEVESRVANNFGQQGRAVGDDLFRVAGFGERIGGSDPMGDGFEPTARAIARGGWLLQQHSISPRENDFHIAAFERIAAEFPIRDLRWSIIHLQQIDGPRLGALRALGAGASAQTWTYLSDRGGPPFRTIVESGVPAGVGTDSTNVSALDPWASLFYMTTGRNLAGDLTNDGQQISRVDALRLYTLGASWFAFDDERLGSFDVGKHADLAVLSDDYLSVPEARLRSIESLLTLVGGVPVWTAGPFAALQVPGPVP